MKNALNQNSTLWDMGVSDLIEETPSLPQAWLTQFHIVKNNNEDNVVLMRPEPSWKSAKAK